MIVTFGLIFYIAVFYLSIYIIPSVFGYYEWMLRVHNPWTPEKGKYDKNANVFKGYLFGLIFLFLATVNVLSVIKTIKTPPGSIPEEREWDMVSEDEAGQSDADSEDERNKLLAQPLTNEGIDIDEEEPK